MIKKKIKRCWPAPNISKPGRAGKLQARACVATYIHVCMESSQGSALPWAQHRFWVTGSERMSWITVCSPCYGRKRPVIPAIGSLGSRWGTALTSLFPSQCFSSLAPCYSELCYPHVSYHNTFFTFSEKLYWTTSSKHFQTVGFPAFSLKYALPHGLTRGGRSIWHCSWRGVGPGFVTEANLFPSHLEDTLLEVLHCSWLSKHRLK